MVLLCVAGFLTGCSSDSGSAGDGREGVLHRDGNQILVGKTAADLAEVTRIAMVRDSTAEVKLRQAGDAFLVEDGVKAKVLESDMLGGIHVRILSGGNANRDGWVPSDYLN